MVQLTIAQFWALAAGGPIAMILTAIVGIIVDIRATSARLDKSEEVLKAEIQRFEGR